MKSISIEKTTIEIDPDQEPTYVSPIRILDMKQWLMVGEEDRLGPARMEEIRKQLRESAEERAKNNT